MWGRSRHFILTVILILLRFPAAQAWERDLTQEGIHPNPGPNDPSPEEGTYIDILFNNLGTLQTR